MRRQSNLKHAVSPPPQARLAKTKYLAVAPIQARKHVRVAAAADHLTTLFGFLIADSTNPDEMTNDRKRSAASLLSAATGSSSSAISSKRRKVDGVQKYYAVKAGRQPGVYLTYAECSAQTAGFKGAVCKLRGSWVEVYEGC